jgi:TetR/AcrR family transcriptional repressor of mexJK operon
MGALSQRIDKRRQILEVARRLFLENGYEGTSMEAIQRAVGGSKATLYAHFPSKERLFEVALEGADAGPLVFELNPGTAPQIVLRKVAEKVLQVCDSAWFVRMQRCVIERAGAAPETAQAFFDNGFGESLRELEGWLRAQHRLGVIHCPQPARSAELFLGMTHGLHAHRALFGLSPLGDSERRSWIRSVVRAFLRLHQKP